MREILLSVQQLLLVLRKPPPPPPPPPPLGSRRSSKHRPIKLLATRSLWKTSIMGKTNCCGEKERTMMRAKA
jgi:hypothetical protein